MPRLCFHRHSRFVPSFSAQNVSAPRCKGHDVPSPPTPPLLREGNPDPPLAKRPLWGCTSRLMIRLSYIAAPVSRKKQGRGGAPGSGRGSIRSEARCSGSAWAARTGRDKCRAGRRWHRAWHGDGGEGRLSDGETPLTWEAIAASGRRMRPPKNQTRKR